VIFVALYSLFRAHDVHPASRSVASGVSCCYFWVLVQLLSSIIDLFRDAFVLKSQWCSKTTPFRNQAVGLLGAGPAGPLTLLSFGSPFELHSVIWLPQAGCLRGCLSLHACSYSRLSHICVRLFVWGVASRVLSDTPSTGLYFLRCCRGLIKAVTVLRHACVASAAA
jgi:hypothetical protein